MVDQVDTNPTMTTSLVFNEEEFQTLVMALTTTHNDIVAKLADATVSDENKASMRAVQVQVMALMDKAYRSIWNSN
jgi:hypothetical protein